MSLNLLTILRLCQALISLLTLILTAIPINFINTHLTLPPVPTSLVFLTFATTYTLLLALPYLVWAPRYFPSLTNRYVSLCVEFITMIFWFAGFVSSAVFIGKLGFCRGSVCGALKAAVVLGAFGWVSWCISLVFPVKYCFFEREPEMIGMNGGANLVKQTDVTRWRLRREGLGKEVDVGEAGEVQRSEFEDDDQEMGFIGRTFFRLRQMMTRGTSVSAVTAHGASEPGTFAGSRHSGTSVVLRADSPSFFVRQSKF